MCASALAYAARAWGAVYARRRRRRGFPYLRRRGPLALIGLSSAVPTAPLHGDRPARQRAARALAAMLDALKHEKLFRVVLIHHPPVSEAQLA